MRETTYVVVMYVFICGGRYSHTSLESHGQRISGLYEEGGNEG